MAACNLLSFVALFNPLPFTISLLPYSLHPNETSTFMFPCTFKIYVIMSLGDFPSVDALFVKDQQLLTLYNLSASLFPSFICYYLDIYVPRHFKTNVIMALHSFTSLTIGALQSVFILILFIYMKLRMFMLRSASLTFHMPFDYQIFQALVPCYLETMTRKSLVIKSEKNINIKFGMNDLVNR